jgi:hypothetical protein
MPRLLTADAVPGSASWSQTDFSGGIKAFGLFGVSGGAGIAPGAQFNVTVPGVDFGDTVVVSLAIDAPTPVGYVTTAVATGTDTVQMSTSAGIAAGEVVTFAIIAVNSL